MRKTSPDAEAASYTKDQLLRSKKYAARRDLLGALLEDGKTYTAAQVDRENNQFLKRKVKRYGFRRRNIPGTEQGAARMLH